MGGQKEKKGKELIERGKKGKERKGRKYPK